MNLAICSFASGSSGNCFLIRTERTALLVDAGISGKQVSEGLAALELSPSDISAVLITHEHSDHIRGLKPVSRATGAPVYLSRGSFEGIPFARELQDVRLFVPGDSFSVGDILVESFPTSHDAADPSGFSFSAGGRRVSVITDTGVMTGECFETVWDSDLFVLESNHDVSMLRIGRYPWFLKQRILSDMGHLSNEDAANALVEMLKKAEDTGRSKKRMVLLAHLSKENNFPQMALATMENILTAGGCRDAVRVEVLSRTERSPLYIL